MVDNKKQRKSTRSFNMEKHIERHFEIEKEEVPVADTSIEKPDSLIDGSTEENTYTSNNRGDCHNRAVGERQDTIACSHAGLLSFRQRLRDSKRRAACACYSQLLPVKDCLCATGVAPAVEVYSFRHVQTARDVLRCERQRADKRTDRGSVEHASS